MVLSLLAGIRTQEARALRWDHVVTWVDDSAGWQPITTAGFDPARAGEDRCALCVWRSERHGGDTKTEKSRRTLALPRRCVEALRQHMEQQERDRLSAGELWQEHGLVFASRVGTPLSANNVIRAFRIITRKAGLGEDWVPREMRHTPCSRFPVRADDWLIRSKTPSCTSRRLSLPAPMVSRVLVCMRHAVSGWSGTSGRAGPA